MEWDLPTIVLDVRPYGEDDAVAAVMTADHGLHRGLVRGGASRGKAAIWQTGNLVQTRWAARLADQLGNFTGELIYPGAANAMQEAMPLAMLTAVCAVAEGALPEREPHPAIFEGLLDLIPRLSLGDSVLTRIVDWESVVLASLGYGLDLSACAVTGRTAALVYVSPRTARAVSRDAAGIWASRLLPLPGFLLGAGEPDMTAWRDGLRLTGHFLARDVFGNQHRPLPLARRMLYDRVCTLVAALEKDMEQTNAG